MSKYIEEVILVDKSDLEIRRLIEEMGMHFKLVKLFSFEYKAKVDHDMTEWELDHVLLGFSDEESQINPNEVAEFAFKPLDEIDRDIKQNPSNYTEWFKICFERVKVEMK